MADAAALLVVDAAVDSDPGVRNVVAVRVFEDGPGHRPSRANVDARAGMHRDRVHRAQLAVDPADLAGKHRVLVAGERGVGELVPRADDELLQGMLEERFGVDLDRVGVVGERDGRRPLDLGPLVEEEPQERQRRHQRDDDDEHRAPVPDISFRTPDRHDRPVAPQWRTGRGRRRAGSEAATGGGARASRHNASGRDGDGVLLGSERPTIGCGRCRGQSSRSVVAVVTRRRNAPATPGGGCPTRRRCTGW